MSLTLWISGLVSITVFVIVLILFSKPPKNKITDKSEDNNPQELLYDHFFERLYDAIFGDKDPVNVAKKYGLEYDIYMLNCRIANYTPNMKKEAMQRVLGTILLLVCVVLSFVLFNPIPFIIGIAFYYLWITSVKSKVAKMAEHRKAQIMIELPRFVDLLHSALEVGLPVDLAIQTTAESVPGIFSEDLRVSLTEMQLGASNWQGALESIAHKYDINILSDFVLDIITAYNKGISITDAVAREAIEIRQNAILVAKERTAKMTTTILVPLAIFKILPLLAIMMIPIIVNILRTFVN